MGEPHIGAADAADKIIARGFGAGALLGAARFQLWRIHAFNPHTDDKRLGKPDIGLHLDGIAVHHALDVGADRPIEGRGRGLRRLAGSTRKHQQSRQRGQGKIAEFPHGL